MTRSEILESARKAVTSDRAATHGKPENTFGMIADLWSARLGQRISPAQVAIMLIDLKTARAWRNIGHMDNWVDIAGYAACGGELAAGHGDQFVGASGEIHPDSKAAIEAILNRGAKGEQGEIRTASMADIRVMIDRGEVTGPSRDAPQHDMPDGFWDSAVSMPPLVGPDGELTMTEAEHMALVDSGGKDGCFYCGAPPDAGIGLFSGMPCCAICDARSEDNDIRRAMLNKARKAHISAQAARIEAINASRRASDQSPVAAAESAEKAPAPAPAASKQPPAPKPPAKRPPPPPAPIAIEDHLAKCRSDNWSYQADLELFENVVEHGFGTGDIAVHMGIDSKAVKDRFDLLTGQYRDANGKWRRLYSRDDVLAALRKIVSKGEGVK